MAALGARRGLCGRRGFLGQGAGRRQPAGRSHPGHEQRRLRRTARQAARRAAGAATARVSADGSDRRMIDRLVSPQYRAVPRRRRCRCGFSKPATSTWCGAACAAAQTFGVALIREGNEVGPAETFDVGTLAKIVDFHQLSDGLLGLSCARRPAVSDSQPQPSGGRAESGAKSSWLAA